MASTEVFFVPEARHVLTIGKDLVTDKAGALIELVKNCYDADATRVNITFAYTEEKEEFVICIEDDGHGMTEDDFLNKWMVPSTSNKKKRKSAKFKRSLQGNKGIGRYAVATLGQGLHLETKTENGAFLSAVINWNDFADPSKKLSEVPIRLEVNNGNSEIPPHGTTLKITAQDDAAKEWMSVDFGRIETQLQKLLPQASSVAPDLDFAIHVRYIGVVDKEDTEVAIKPLNLFDFYQYLIEARYDEDSQTINYTYNSAALLDVSDEGSGTLNCKELGINGGDSTDFLRGFHCSFSVFDRDKPGLKRIIARAREKATDGLLTEKKIKDRLDLASGVMLTRNGFRIRPFGEPSYDWLGLNQRRVNNPTQRISANQIVGYVNIGDEVATGIIEHSSRQGVLENQAFESLKLTVQEILGRLETRRMKERARSRVKDENPLTLQEKAFASRKEADDRTLAMLKKHNIAPAIIEEIADEQIKGQATEHSQIKRAAEFLALNQRRIFLGRLTELLFHELQQPLPLLKTNFKLLFMAIQSFCNGSTSLETLKESSETYRDRIGYAIDKLGDLIRMTSGMQTAKNIKPSNVNLKDAFRTAIKHYEQLPVVQDVEFNIDGDASIAIWARQIELVILFGNLIDNSLAWKKSKAKNKISFHIEGDEHAWQITYRDSGQGIDEDDIRKGSIFEPGFTRKSDGSGLGLGIAREMARNLNLVLDAIPSTEGAHFTITYSRSLTT